MTTIRTWAVLVAAVGLSSTGFAQETPLTRDDPIDSILEKLSDSKTGDDKKADRPAAPEKKASDKARSTDAGQKPGAAKGNADQPSKSGGAPKLDGQDQEVDDFLKKLGETVDTPAPDDPQRGGSPSGEKRESGGMPKPQGPAEKNRLTARDKETDQHLEELTGRKRRRRQDDGQRGGAAGDLIKEMRDIEQKLAKPDTGEKTREEQKQIVKRIETMIEQAQRSGSSSMRMVARRRQQPGQKPGQQQGQTEGAMAQGPPPSKPLKPTNKHSSASGKNIWGHLPPEIRAEIDNMINEQPLASKEELIDRYYLSVGKGKPIREESP